VVGAAAATTVSSPCVPFTRRRGTRFTSSEPFWTIPTPEFAAGFAVGDRDGAAGTCPARWFAEIYPTAANPAPAQGALGAKVRPVTRLGWNGSDRKQGPQTVGNCTPS
jgi:hypothetical protein